MSDTDDAPLWAEVTSVLFGPALWTRTMLHFYVAAELSGERQAFTEKDVTLASPVPEIRGTRIDVAARAMCSLAAVAAFAFTPLSFPTAAMGLLEQASQLWLSLNCIVLWMDPFGYVLHNATTDTDTMTHDKHADGGHR